MNNTTVLALKNIARIFKQGGEEIKVLSSINLEIRQGEMVALVGASGSGKSTLLQIAGLLDKPTSGEVHINGINYTGAGDNERTLARRKNIGFIYQFHHLLPEFSALENITMPLLICGEDETSARKKSKQLLKYIGLEKRSNHRPSRLSGGEQQRVAILRAVVTRPSLILADEPTGNLDPNNSEVAFSMLQKLVKESGIAALIATHNMELANRMDRVINLH